MTEEIEQLLKELSEIYDPNSNDSYVSLYFNKKNDNKFLQRRKKAIQKILKGETLKNFLETMDLVENEIKNIRGDNIAVFSSKKNDYQKSISVTVQMENLLVVDSSPYLRPLARIQDEWESFTLLLVNTNYAKIFSISLGKTDSTKSLSADIMNRHKKGGQSQARFNRLRRGAIKHFLKEVTEALEEKIDEQIIIAGPGNAKKQLIDMLPKHINDRVIEVIDIDIDDENDLLKSSIQIVSEKEKQKSYDAVKQLKTEILKDGLAVYGVDETIEAVQNGQVELLIIQKDFKPRGWICEHCQLVKEGIQKKCPYCDSDTSEVDVLEEIIEFAKRTDAQVEFTDDEEIRDLGHVGGILRFK